jgi:hypothetical protein
VLTDAIKLNKENIIQYKKDLGWEGENGGRKLRKVFTT